MNTSELFDSIHEPFAAGLFEDPDAPRIIRYANALKRFWEHTQLPPYDGGLLYPCGVSSFNYDPEIIVHPHYCNTFFLCDYKVDRNTLAEKSPEAAQIMLEESRLVVDFQDSPHCVGGMGWTHSFPNYARVLREGLAQYRSRVEALPQGDFRSSMLCVLEAIAIYHARCLEILRRDGAPAELITALEKVPFRPAETVYEALVGLNFLYYVDGCDDIGPLDRILLPYYRGEDLVPLLRELFRHIDCNHGWSGTLGPDYNEITGMCLRAIHNGRRPNLQLLVKPDMPDWVWDECVASLGTSCGQPALYNYPLYMDTMRKLMPQIPEKDLAHLAFGGCTETMLEGMSAVGSDDAGINVALVFSDYMRAALKSCDSYEDFFAGFVRTLRTVVAETLDRLNLYRKTRAMYRPSVVRTLLVEDCIDTQTEFNAGGARWVWSMINHAGVINVIDSLNVIRTMVYEEKRHTAEEFLRLLDAQDPQFLARARQCPSYGNNNADADRIGTALVNALADALDQRECYPRGKFYPVANQFTTYMAAGKHIPATPDGRAAGDPLCDSLSAIHGNDRKGPTALLNSVSSLPLHRIIGTPITNIRISKAHLPAVLKPLVTGFFDQGGMQLQVSCLSREEMLDAVAHPERHESLVVRIGGYSEYFTKLAPTLQQTVIDRTEH